ncbi:MAG: RNAse (barnase) inhibitor barstar [Arenicella sp.]|jgi:RNAse (barnase) inhibitor barstar
MIIDLGNINSPQELHLKLKTAFQFGDDYGMNWDSFLTFLKREEENLPYEVILRNWKALEHSFPTDAELFKERVADFNRDALEVEIGIEQVF